MFKALPNPRGGSVRLAEMALADALHAFQRQGETAPALKRAISALHSAGWLPAQRFAEALALVVPLGDESDPTRNRIAESIAVFGAAVERHNRANCRARPCCSITISRAACIARAAYPGAPVSYDDLALAGHAIAPATLSGIAPDRLS